MLFNSTVCALQHGTCVITNHYTLMGRPSVMSITIIISFQMLCHRAEKKCAGELLDLGWLGEKKPFMT